MDILNFISWIRGKRQVTSVDPTKTLIPVGLKDGRRDDEYLAGAISVEDFANQLIPPPTPSTNIYNSNGTLTGNRTLSGNLNNLVFNNLNNLVFDNLNYFRTKYQNNDSGIILDWGNGVFGFGAGPAGGQSGTSLIIETVGNERSRFWHQNNVKGLSLNFITRQYEFGQITGNNTTTLKIDDAAAFPVQVSGTNVSANTAGASSGQFLKIKVNGVDYKIALLNP